MGPLCFILIHSLLTLSSSFSREFPPVNAFKNLSLESKITQSTNLSEGLLSTDFLKNSHAYVRDMEKRSGFPLVHKQKSELKRALREGRFKKLKSLDYIHHKREYTDLRMKLIIEWEKHTCKSSPKSENINSKTGEIKMLYHQFHHIIPQELGGPNAWWNGHPLKAGQDHQGGVHKRNSPLNKIIDQWVNNSKE